MIIDENEKISTQSFFEKHVLGNMYAINIFDQMVNTHKED